MGLEVLYLVYNLSSVDFLGDFLIPTIFFVGTSSLFSSYYVAVLYLVDYS